MYNGKTGFIIIQYFCESREVICFLKSSKINIHSLVGTVVGMFIYNNTPKSLIIQSKKAIDPHHSF